MYKKLEEETIDDILEAGIDEFIEKGLQGAGHERHREKVRRQCRRDL